MSLYVASKNGTLLAHKIGPSAASSAMIPAVSPLTSPNGRNISEFVNGLEYGQDSTEQ